MTLNPSDTPETTAERRRILDEAQAYTWPSWSVQPCGTAAAYQRHIRHHEPPCRACTNAAAAERLRNKRQAKP